MKFEKFVMPSHVWNEVDDQLALEGNIWVNNIYEGGILIFLTIMGNLAKNDKKVSR